MVFLFCGTRRGWRIGFAKPDKERKLIYNLTVEHREHVSDRTYKTVLDALLALTGSVEEGYSQVAAQAANQEAFKAIFKAREGSSGFMRFEMLDHGDLLTMHGRPAKARLVILGNPLIAVTMLRHATGAGLNVPVRILIYEDQDGRTRVAYDLPSSLMSGLESPEVMAAAQRLDEKLIALSEAISGVTA
jgi:uncharacterized protein (DUF302 family)